MTTSDMPEQGLDVPKDGTNAGYSIQPMDKIGVTDNDTIIRKDSLSVGRSITPSLPPAMTAPQYTTGRQPGHTPDVKSKCEPGTNPEECSNDISVVIANHELRVKQIWPVPSDKPRQAFPDFCALYDKIKAYNRPNYLGGPHPPRK